MMILSWVRCYLFSRAVHPLKIRIYRPRKKRAMGRDTLRAKNKILTTGRKVDYPQNNPFMILA